MSLKCLFGHRWIGCKCERCGKTQDITLEHKFVVVDGKCIEKCTICGKEIPLIHKCKFVAVDGKCIVKCTICGVEYTKHRGVGCVCIFCGKMIRPHSWYDNQCTHCGKTKTQVTGKICMFYNNGKCVAGGELHNCSAKPHDFGHCYVYNLHYTKDIRVLYDNNVQING